MTYEFLLLADPSPAREAVLAEFGRRADLQVDPADPTRFRAAGPGGLIRLSIGSKDPVESIHLEVEPPVRPCLELAAKLALDLAARLGMRVEDIQWGRELTVETLPGLRAYWDEQERPPGSTAAPAKRPWWRIW